MTSRKRAVRNVAPATPEPSPIIVEEPPVMVTPTPKVRLDSLQIGNEFEYGDVRYRKFGFQAGRVVALQLSNPEMGWVGVRQVGLDPDQLVIKV